MAESKSNVIIGLSAIFLGFIGGIISALLGAGVLFPQQEWSPEIRKSSTAQVEIKIPPSKHSREYIIQAKLRGKGDKGALLEPEILINDEIRNLRSAVYSHEPVPSGEGMTEQELFNSLSDLEGDEFLILEWPSGEELNILVKSFQKGVRSTSVDVSIRFKRERSIFN